MTLVFTVGILVACCAGVSSERQLTIGTTGWDESVAISNLTEALLKDELGYDRVELKTLDVASTFEGVGGGALDAFQNVQMLSHQEYPNLVRDDVELLDPWFQGTTRVGIAAPSYMNIASIPQLNQTRAEEIIGIEPEAALSKRIPDEVIPTYQLQQEYVQWDGAPAIALRGRQAYPQQGGVRFYRLVAALDEPEVRLRLFR